MFIAIVLVPFASMKIRIIWCDVCFHDPFYHPQFLSVEISIRNFVVSLAVDVEKRKKNPINAESVNIRRMNCWIFSAENEMKSFRKEKLLIASEFVLNAMEKFSIAINYNKKI